MADEVYDGAIGIDLGMSLKTPNVGIVSLLSRKLKLIKRFSRHHLLLRYVYHPSLHWDDFNSNLDDHRCD